MRMLIALLAMTTGQAHPQDTLSEAKAKAEAYRAGQPRTAIGAYTLAGGRSANGQGLSPQPAPPVYAYQVIGDGYDILHLQPTGLCLDPSTITTGSLGVWQGETSFTLAKTDQDISSYLSTTAVINGGLNAAVWQAKTSFSASSMDTLEMATNRLAIVARYDYTRGRRFLAAPLPKLAPAFLDLAESDRGREAFFLNCGVTYLDAVDEGASLLVLFVATKIKEDHATDDEIKATFSAKYGIGSGDGSIGLTDRQKQILESYTVSSQCFVLGGDPSVCRFISEQNDINSAWQALVAGMTSNPSQVAAIHTRYQPYTNIIGPSKPLAAFQTFLNALGAWEGVRSQIHFVCQSAPYMNCDDANADIDASEKQCMDQNMTCNTGPGAGLYGQWYQADIGYSNFYQGQRLEGPSLQYHFAVQTPDFPGALKPYVLYDLTEVGWNDLIRSFDMGTLTSDPFSQHWSLELYEHPDGTGRSITSAQGFQGASWDALPQGIDRNMTSFRVVPRTL